VHGGEGKFPAVHVVGQSNKSLTTYSILFILS
jgi:hypothetical protein